MTWFTLRTFFKSIDTLSKALIFRQEKTLSRRLLILSTLFGVISLSACQSVPNTAIGDDQKSTTSSTVIRSSSSTSTVDDYNLDDDASNEVAYSDDYNLESEVDYPIESYTPPESDTAPNDTIEPTLSYPSNDDETPNDVIIITPPSPTPHTVPSTTTPTTTLPSRDQLLQQARKNTQQPTTKATSNNVDLPAFRNLMQMGTNQLKAGQLTAAENSFTRAQRLAPRSSAVYFYLSQVALKKNQPRKAEAMARRGLNVSEDSVRRRALWQLILRSGQQQNNARVILEAQQALR